MKATTSDAMILVFGIRYDIDTIRYGQYRLDISFGRYIVASLATTVLTLPYLTFGVGRLLHLPSAEAVSVRPNAQPRCNRKVTVIGCEAETSAVKPNKSPATWDW